VKFSKAKIIVFFTAMLLMAWFLYPRELFLGFIYEGTAALERAETHYKSYLSKNEKNKFATLRLASLYERMGKPEQATPLLEGLYEYRTKDWKVATVYLDHLENMHDEKKLYLLRRQVADHFMNAPLFPKGRVLLLLEGALDYAIWLQDTEAVYSIINDIVAISRRSADYEALKADFDRGLQKTDRILKFLQENLADDPSQEAIREEISNIHLVLGEIDKAITVLTEGLILNPESKGLLEARIVLYVKGKDLIHAIEDTRSLLSFDSLYSGERSDYIRQLAIFYYETKQEENLRKLYQETIRSEELSSEDRMFFVDRLDIHYRDLKLMDQVVSLYEEVLEMDSIELASKYDYVSKLAYLYAQHKKPERLTALYEKVLQDSNLAVEDRIELYEVLAYEYTQQKKTERVVAVYRNAIESSVLQTEEKIPFVETLAAYFVKKRKMNEVVALYNEVLDWDDLDLEDRIKMIDSLAFVYTQQDRGNELTVLYRKVMNEKNLDMETRLDYVEQLASFYSKQKDIEKVIALYQEIIHWKDLDQEELVNLTDSLIFVHSQQRQWERFIEVYQEAILSERLDLKKRIDYVHQLASFYAKRKETDKVVALYRETLNWDELGQEERAQLIDSLAFVYNKVKDVDRLVAVYRDAFLSDQLSFEMRIDYVEQLAAFYTKSKMKDKVFPLYQEVLSLEGLGSEGRGRILENMVFAYDKNGQSQEAITLCLKSIESGELASKEKAMFVELLVGFYTKKKSKDKIVALYEKAIHMEDFDFTTKSHFIEPLAFFYSKMKKFDRVESLYTEALHWEELDMKQRLYFVELLAATYSKMKRTDQLVSLYQEVIFWKGVEIKERLYFVELLASTYNEMKMTDQVGSLYKEAITWEGIELKQRLYLVELLAATYSNKKEHTSLANLYKEALSWDGLDSKERLNFIELLALLYGRGTEMPGHDDLMILYDDEIIEQRLKVKEKVSLSHFFAEIFVKQGDMSRSEYLYEQAIEIDPENPENWMQLVYFFEGLKRTDDQIDLMKHYLSRFPEDTAGLKLLVELYLYKKKDLLQMPLYLSYVRSARDEELALGLAYILLQKKMDKNAIRWVEDTFPYFGHSAKLPMMIIDMYLVKKNNDRALKFTEDMLDVSPKQAKLLAIAALLSALQEDIEGSDAYFDRLDAIETIDADTLHWIGKEAYFSGKHARAASYLKKATALDADNGAYWFWYSQVLSSLEQDREARKALQQVETLLAKKSFRSLEEERMYLKTKSRLAYGPKTEGLYLEMIRKYPKEDVFYEDLFEVYLEQKQIEKADQLLGKYRQSFPKKENEALQYEAYVASLQKNWDRAIHINRALLKKDPTNFGASYALAAAYYNAGQWPQAIETYQSIGILSKGEKAALEPLKALREVYDDRLTAEYAMGIFGTDNFLEGTVRYESFIRPDLKFDGVIRTGLHKASAANFHDYAEKGKFSVESHTLEGFSWKAGVGYGFSPLRKTPSVSASVQYEQPSKYSASAGFDYRELRTDFPQAVSGGALADTARIDADYHWTDRLYLYQRFEWRRDYLPNGLQAFEYFFEPGITYDLLKDPLLNMGYHFTFSQVALDDGFSDSVPLLEKLRSHIIALQFNHDIGKKFFYGASIFAGEDTAKGTHIYKGDLLGIGANVKWKIRPWISGKASYGFGRESLASIAGVSHQFNIAFSGHWN
jgi:hypothetical protein